MNNKPKEEWPLTRDGADNVRFAPVSIMLIEGRSYRNGHGDVCGPMQRRTKDVWLDGTGTLYHPNGRQWNHSYDSAGNLFCIEPEPSSPKNRYQRLPPGECKYCDEHRDDQMMPPHYASTRCESGQHTHCTCDTCF